MGDIVIISAVAALAKIIETVSTASETASSVGSLFKGIDQILHAQDAVAADTSEEMSVTAAAEQVIQAKKTAESLSILAARINRRWGPNTWEEILSLRAGRIKARAAAVEAEKERIADRKASIKKVFLEITKFLAMAVILGLGAWAIWRIASCREGAC